MRLVWDQPQDERSPRHLQTLKFLERPQLHSLTYPVQMASTAPYSLKTANENGSDPGNSGQTVYSKGGRSLSLPGVS